MSVNKIDRHKFHSASEISVFLHHKSFERFNNTIKILLGGIFLYKFPNRKKRLILYYFVCAAEKCDFNFERVSRFRADLLGKQVSK